MNDKEKPYMSDRVRKCWNNGVDSWLQGICPCCVSSKRWITMIIKRWLMFLIPFLFMFSVKAPKETFQISNFLTQTESPFIKKLLQCSWCMTSGSLLELVSLWPDHFWKKKTPHICSQGSDSDNHIHTRDSWILHYKRHDL